jgi:hypothetical protein
MKHHFCFNPPLVDRRRKLVTFLVFSVVLLISVGRIEAQDIAGLDKAYHPGEQVHVVITFAGPVDLSGGGILFNLDKLDDDAQRLWTRGFNLTTLKRLQPNQYEATGVIPEYAASGIYRLIRAWSGVADLTKGYDYPDTLHQSLTIRVINEKRDPLPTLTELHIVR